MKYRVFINGGFANIPKKYEGELSLEKELKTTLLNSMKIKTQPSTEIRDGFIYHLKFEDGGTEYIAVFDENNLPEKLREFIDNVIKKK